MLVFHSFSGSIYYLYKYRMRDRRQHFKLMEALMATSDAAGMGVSALTDVPTAPIIDWINERCANPGGT